MNALFEIVFVVAGAVLFAAVARLFAKRRRARLDIASILPGSGSQNWEKLAKQTSVVTPSPDVLSSEHFRLLARLERKLDQLIATMPQPESFWHFIVYSLLGWVLGKLAEELLRLAVW